jgi:hypothetical protein
LALQLFFCSAQTSNIRIATAEDKKAIPNAHVGDIIVSGPTRTNENKIICCPKEEDWFGPSYTHMDRSTLLPLNWKRIPQI